MSLDVELRHELQSILVVGAVWTGAAFGGSDSWDDRRLTVVLLIILVAAVPLGLLGMASAALLTRRDERRWVGGRPGPVVGALVLCGAAGLAGVVVAARAEAAYRPMEPGLLRAVATVRSDPEPAGIGWTVIVQLDSGERLEATAFGPSGFTVQQVEVGERVLVEGRVRTVGDRPWLHNRHLVGRLGVDRIERIGAVGPLDRLVNDLRGLVGDGAIGFDARDEALYLGLVIGDDRFQDLSQKARFRAAGLTHLLAVSGQNVAFVLLVARPLLLHCGYRVRFVLIVVILVLFVAVTRAEPSVLRAAAVAAVGAWAAVTGRTRSGLRTLAWGVAAMIMLDPFLVRVVGFQLSVAASGGIIVFGPALVRRIPLPGAVSEALAVTVAAQLGVAPLLIGYFGPLPLASVPANLLAGWAAGAVMTAGLTVGPLAGLVSEAGFEPVAMVMQLPTRLLIAWIDLAARWSTNAGLPRLDGRSLLVAAAACLILGVRPRSGRWAAVVVATATAALALTLLSTTPRRPSGPVELGSGAVYLPAGNAAAAAGDGGTPSVLVLPVDCSTTLVDELLEHDIDSIDVVVSEAGDRRAATLVRAVVDVAEVRVILAPPLHRIRGATRVTTGRVIDNGWATVNVEPPSRGRRLSVSLVLVAPGSGG